MSERYKVLNSLYPTFITITVTGWVDLFIRRVYTKILDDSLNYCIKNKGLTVHAYVYMTSHIHLIVSSEKSELASIIRDFKRHTSKELVEAVKDINESRREWLLNKFSFEAKRSGRTKNYKLWQDGFHPITFLKLRLFALQMRLKNTHVRQKLSATLIMLTLSRKCSEEREVELDFF